MSEHNTYAPSFALAAAALCDEYGADPAAVQKMLETMTAGKVGRKSKYTAECPGQAAKLCAEHGATCTDLAKFFGVSTSTIDKWLVVHPDFRAAVRGAQDEWEKAALLRVKRSMYDRAIGMTVKTEKIFMPAGAKAPVRVTTFEYYPPDVRACEVILRNRDPANWGAKDGGGTSIQVNNVNGAPRNLNEVAPQLTKDDVAFLELLF